MRQEPYRSAPASVLDHGQRLLAPRSSVHPALAATLAHDHSGAHSGARQLVNQVEVYLSGIQRKVLTPNDFHSLAEVKDRLLRFQDHYGAVARPLQWKFSREDCRTLLAKIHTHQQTFRKAA